ncbi:MAG: TrmH family RNA methyltransferase [Acidimicrobiia bacterium]
MEPVRNHRNKLVVEAARLHRARFRKERRQTILEGPNLLADALEAGVTLHTVFSLPTDDATASLCSDHGLRPLLIDDGALHRLAGTEEPRGPIAVMDIPGDSLPFERNVLVSVGVSDPGNVGTLVRTAAAFGWSYAHTAGSADPWAPKTLRAGAGGQLQTAVTRLGDFSALETWTKVAMVVEGGVTPDEVDGTPLAVLVGEESAGLSDEAVATASWRVSIPMRGSTESLNAAVAAGIVVYELSKRTGRPPGQV